MNKQHASRTAANHSVMSGRFAELYLADDIIGDEFDWESETMVQGETLASDVQAFLGECD